MNASESLLSFSAEDEEADERDEAVEHEQFVAESVLPPTWRPPVEQSTEQRGSDADVRYAAIGNPLSCEEAEGIKPEQRSVGVGCHDVDGVDDTCVVERPKNDDAEQEGQAHDQVDAVADFALAFSVSYAVFQV